jgi:hypothetical protein
MKSVFILWYVYGETDDGHLLAGVYASNADALAAIERLKYMPGFASNPKGFQMDEYEIGKDHWTEGFLSGR